MHAAPRLAKSLLISSYSSKKCSAKISLAYFTKLFITYFYGWRTYLFNLPLSVPACCWVPFRLSNSLSQHQSSSQAELSKSTRDDFKVSKRKRTRSLSEYITIYQSSLQGDFCIPNYLVTMPLSKGRASSPLKEVLDILYA